VDSKYLRIFSTLIDEMEKMSPGEQLQSELLEQLEKRTEEVE